MPGFQVRTVEGVLNEKKDNLCSRLRDDMGVSQERLDDLDAMFSQQGQTMTLFCQTHLGGMNRDKVNYDQLSRMCVGRLDVLQGKHEEAVELVEKYLRCFASLIC